MTRARGIACWLCVLTLWWSISRPQCALAQARDAQLTKIFADWQERQEAIKSIRYVVQGERVIAKGSGVDSYGRPLKPESPPRDIACPVQWTFLVDFVTGRYRREVTEQLYESATGKSYPRITVDAFDGAVIRGAKPRQANTSANFTPSPLNPDVVTVSGNLRGAPFQSEYLPLFFGHGIIRTIEDEIYPGGFKKKMDPTYFHVHGNGVQSGRPCVVIRTQALKLSTTSYDEYWVDTGRKSSILRYVEYSADKPFNDLVIVYKEVSKHWLPERWTFTHYNGGRTCFFDRMAANVRIDPDFSDADFQIGISAGMVVEERHYGESPNPLVTPEAERKFYAISESGGKTEIIDGIKVKTWSVWKWWIPIALLAAGLIVWFAFRRRSRVGNSP